MMKILVKKTKMIAAVLMILFLIQLLTPAVAYGLTSGPSQPEMKSFQPIGNSDMVDLFTGDFSYNIPLLDVGGYPVNLSYSSGASMDDESSWVGFGWNLNPGAVNRQLRGIPDDFNGADELDKEKNIKPHITKGISSRIKVDLLGIPGKKKLKNKKKSKAVKFSPSISIGVKYDNYRGIGTQLGLNAGLSIGEATAGNNTAGLGESKINNQDDSTSFKPKASANFGLNLSSLDGATADVNFSFINHAIANSNFSLTNNVGFSYNSRSGLQGMTLGASYNLQTAAKTDLTGAKYLSGSASSFVSFVGNTYVPSIEFPMKSKAYTVDISLGGQLQFFYIGGGITGFYNSQELAFNKISKPAYGFLYSEKGANDKNAVMDFNREKDVPYNKEVNYLPIPVPTNDLFSVSSQTGGGQYRIYRGGSGVFFDNTTDGVNNDFSFGIEIGFGNFFDIGGDFHWQKSTTHTQKWIDKNDFLPLGDYKKSEDILHEQAYFKRVGEPLIADQQYQSLLNNSSPVAVKLKDRLQGKSINGAAISNDLRSNNNHTYYPGKIVRNVRDRRNNNFSFLVAHEASLNGFSKKINSYPFDTLVLGEFINAGKVRQFNRVESSLRGFSKTNVRKPHHISEITVTAEDGKRMIYGIPVYNKYQEEVTFSINEDLSKRNTGIIGYQHNTTNGDNSIQNTKGREHYYSKDRTPGYATNYLLTEILSPDYVDQTGNGVSDDDLGTAVKFNYSKLSKDYKWRAPFDSANYNEGFLSDNKDDKASYVYGEKEIWYLHSIESKTMIAQFIVEDRKDGLGVMGDAGGINPDVRLKYLKEIRLYSKSDLVDNKTDLSKVIPIKVVHFEYDYSIQNHLPNNEEGKGKLTLKRVYFTFGSNLKGQLNPYEFFYNIDPHNNEYTTRQYDRWGNYKNAETNPSGLNNAEYPYALQDSGLAGHYAGLWQMNKIVLPSGGSIDVTYESDDYAYVQDKRSSSMCLINGIGTIGSSQGLIGANEILVSLPKPLSAFGSFNSEADKKKALKFYYFGEQQYLYFKTFIDLDHQGHKEFVPGFAKILDYRLENDQTVAIKLEKWGDEKGKPTNPIAFTAWQFLRNNLPKLAYPGYDNMDDNGSDFKKAVTSLVTALGSIKELTKGFSGIARSKNYCNSMELGKSWVRLMNPDFKKLGGGSRVKKLVVSDNWQAMVGNSNGQTSLYTTVYDYTTTVTNSEGKQMNISSGVASYEPLIGSDENPFHQPIFYRQKVPLFASEFSYFEQPFGESFYPAPIVGYSRVTVKTIGSGQTSSNTGTVVNEFYTSKDFPTKVSVLSLEKRKPGTEKILKIFRISIRDIVGLSQGYAIENNDMHGKPKAAIIYNQGGSEISKQEFFYKNENELSESKTLSNKVPLIYPDGTVKDGAIGQEMEMFTDMRDQRTENFGIRIQASSGAGGIGPLPFLFMIPGVGPNNELRSFRSSSTIKLINKFSILEKVRKTENGSSITTENLAWDPYTGEVLLTKTQNEYNEPVYNFTYPAHWAYNGMGQAYQNLGTYLYGLTTNSNGEIVNNNYVSGRQQILIGGDEIIDVNNSRKFWVINTNNKLRLINEKGELQIVSGITGKILRSGRRNLADDAIASITSLKNPVSNGKLDISQLTKVLDAKSTLFKEEWSMPLPYCQTCPEGYTLTEDGERCYKDTLPIQPNYFTVCAASRNSAYSSCGTYYFECDSINLKRINLTTTNSFWLANSAQKQDQCNYSPTLIPIQNYGMVCNLPAQSISSFSASTYSYSQVNVENSSADTLPSYSVSTAGTYSFASPNYGGPLNRTGIWVCSNDNLADNTWLGFSRQINIPQSKTYYLGVGSDNAFRILVDGSSVLYSANELDPENFKIWNVFPVYLTAGIHTLQFEAKNRGSSASFGAELYNNTLTELANASGYSSIDTLFSTQNMIGQHFSSGELKCIDGAEQIFDHNGLRCRIYAGKMQMPFNPYYSGVLGNWRPFESYVYHTDRSRETGVNASPEKTDIRKGGIYSYFSAFWKYDDASGSFIRDMNVNASGLPDPDWIASSSMTFYNRKGIDIENMDALNRYSASLYGYLESLPVAVASNARVSEIAYDGFEDYSFDLACSAPLLCKVSPHFSFQALINNSTVTRSAEEMHSGKYALKIDDPVGVTITKNIQAPGNMDASVFSIDPIGRYLYDPQKGLNGFAPIANKKYIFSCWIKDQSPLTSSTIARISINGNDTYINANTKLPVVEGWKRVEFPFIMPANAVSINISTGGAGVVYVDDVRVFPFDGQMKTFAYDPSSQRLWAEMDENNFATFYEYDDEGGLIRIKKETEKGIVTIKESRSSIRKK